MCAAMSGDEKRVRELLAAGAKPDLVTKANWSALLFACGRGSAGVVKLLLDGKFEEEGAAVDRVTAGGDTPLTWASFGGFEAVVRILLERGADVPLGGDYTALRWARDRGHKAIAALLEAHGARA